MTLDYRLPPFFPAWIGAKDLPGSIKVYMEFVGEVEERYMMGSKNLFKWGVKGDNILQVYTFILSGIHEIGVKLWKGERLF
jgi:hypothetical protein